MSHIECPVCRTGMKTIERAGVEIDTCPQCRGVWLDRGELEKLSERLGGAPRRDGDSAIASVVPRARPAAWRGDDDDDHDDDDGKWRKRAETEREGYRGGDYKRDDDRAKYKPAAKSRFTRLMDFFD